MTDVFAFECRHAKDDCPRRGTIYNATTRGKAINQFYHDVIDCWPDVKFTDLRARKIGPAHTSEQFIRNAIYRGMPDVRCGQRVKVGDVFGYIVGHNSSANFDVLFDEGGRYGGLTLNVHPADVELLLHASPASLPSVPPSVET